MKKSLLILCLIMIVFCFPLINLENTFVAKAVEENSAVVSTPISNAEDLKNINLDGNYYLNNDIVLNDISFNPIGATSDSGSISYTPFTGVLDGKGHTIKGLRLDTTAGHCNLGLFGMLENATIKNLKIEVVYLKFNNNINNVSSVNIGAIAGQTSGAIIEQCAVEYIVDSANYDSNNLQFCVNTKNSFYLGGLVGNSMSGSVIKNSYSKIVFDNISKDMTQGVNVSIGGLVGELYNGKIYNSYSDSSLKFSTSQTNDEISVCIGGLAGTVIGANSQIISSYSSMILDSTHQYTFGSAIGKIDKSLTPNNKNLNYIYGYAQYKLNTYIQNIELIGQLNNYNSENCLLTKLTENDYSIFENLQNFSSEYYWNFDDVWSSVGGNFPILQRFKKYVSTLSATPIADYGVLSPSDNVATMTFVETIDTNNLSYGDPVGIKIEIAENYKKYFQLDTIMVANTIVYNARNNYDNNPLFTVTSPTNEEPYYLVNYTMNDKTQGQVSYSLSKISYDLEVYTENSSMGKVRNQYSSTNTNSFIQSISYGNSYNFFAIADSSNFAFSNWLFVFDDQQEAILVESTMSNFTFIFGEENLSKQTYNDYIFSGGKLMAQWTSNICKVNVDIRLKNGVEATGCDIYDKDGNEVADEISFSKGSEIILTAEVKEGYQFEGWYDNTGRILGNSKTLNYVLDGEIEQMTIVARISEINVQVNLTWLWITLGVIGGLAIIALVIFIIIRKSKSGDYKNFY